MPTFQNTLSVPSSYLSDYEDGTECSETSAYKIQTPEYYPEENIQHSEHGKSTKSRTMLYFSTIHKIHIYIRGTTNFIILYHQMWLHIATIYMHIKPKFQLQISFLVRMRFQSLNIINFKRYLCIYEGWNFNSGNYLFTTDTK